MSISVWVLTQKYTSITASFRENVAAVVLFYTPTAKTMKNIFEDYAGKMSAEEYKAYLVFLLRHPFGVSLSRCLAFGVPLCGNTWPFWSPEASPKKPSGSKNYLRPPRCFFPVVFCWGYFCEKELLLEHWKFGKTMVSTIHWRRKPATDTRGLPWDSPALPTESVRTGRRAYADVIAKFSGIIYHPWCSARVHSAAGRY